jgi:peptide/nickel transport system permease protein
MSVGLADIMGFGTYLFRRALRAGLVVFGAAVLIFFLVRVLPGDSARLALGPSATEEQVNALRRMWGLERPIYEQFFTFVTGLLSGDWGVSLRTRNPVFSEISIFLPSTAELTLFSLFITVFVGFPLGVIAAANRNKLPDHISRILSLGGLALPQFWLAIVIQLALAYYLRLLPIQGRLLIGMNPPQPITGMYLLDSLLTLNWTTFVDSFLHLLLPGSVLSFTGLAQISRYTRSSMIDEMDKDYVELAKAYGLPRRLVLYGYMLINALPASLTQLALIFGYSFGGALLIEAVYSWPGMGLYIILAVYWKDLNAITASVVVIALTVSAATLVSDILNAFIDPRIRLGEK